MFERVQTMLIKEFIQVFRDPRMRMMIFIMPVVQLLIFGYAVTTDVRHVATAVQDLDGTPGSRELISRFARSGYFDIVEYVTDDARARWLLDRGKVSVVLRLDRGFDETLRGGRTAEVQVIVDGADSNTARIVLNYSAAIARGFSDQVLARQQARHTGSPPPARAVVLASRAWFNGNLESRNFYVPGVVATLVMLVTLLLTSMAVVREKEIGTIEQLMVTPITPFEFILGKTAPFALIAFVDVLLITAVGVFWFDVPIRGSVLLLLVCAGLYLLTTLGIGLLVSTISQTQQQAMMTAFFFYMPALLLSGFMFPIANMPLEVQWVTYLNPLRYFLVIIRGLFLKGVGVDVLWPQMAALAVLGLATMGLAVRRFRKTLA